MLGDAARVPEAAVSRLPLASSPLIVARNHRPPDTPPKVHVGQRLHPRSLDCRCCVVTAVAGAPALSPPIMDCCCSCCCVSGTAAAPPPSQRLLRHSLFSIDLLSSPGTAHEGLPLERPTRSDACATPLLHRDQVFEALHQHHRGVFPCRDESKVEQSVISN